MWCIFVLIYVLICEFNVLGVSFLFVIGLLIDIVMMFGNFVNELCGYICFVLCVIGMIGVLVLIVKCVLFVLYLFCLLIGVCVFLGNMIIYVFFDRCFLFWWIIELNVFLFFLWLMLIMCSSLSV